MVLPGVYGSSVELKVAALLNDVTITVYQRRDGVYSFMESHNGGQSHQIYLLFLYNEVHYQHLSLSPAADLPATGMNHDIII